MKFNQATIIKVAAVVTATPRWVGALLAAEGLTVPEAWATWWIWISVILNAAMAVVEGLAFAYVFNAWRNQRDKGANRLLAFALVTAIVFVAVLSPFIAAQVRDVTVSDTLRSDASLWLWSAAVAASTITVVASVGYAQKQQAQPRKAQAQQPQPLTFEAQVETIRAQGLSKGATCAAIWALSGNGYGVLTSAQVAELAGCSARTAQTARGKEI